MTQPWENEPNRVEFKYKGYDCLINRARPKGGNYNNPDDWLGHLCGYVAVPKGHLFYRETWGGDGYKKIYDLDVHGGITYTDHCHGEICHKTEGQDDVWWLGFDCAHMGDLIPGMWHHRQPGGILYDETRSFSKLNRMGTYKTIEFVENEIKKLVDQLEEAKENARE